jgi:VWFA-related protein
MLLLSDAERMTDAARRGNVPIYPIYPRGLTDGMEDATSIPMIGGSASASTSQALLGEVRRAQDNLRVLADDTGGVPIVGTNDLAGGLDRIVKLSSAYYVLGYDSSNAKPDGRFHRIDVRVSRPGARVVSRKGFVQSRPTTDSAQPLPDRRIVGVARVANAARR